MEESSGIMADHLRELPHEALILAEAIPGVEVVAEATVEVLVGATAGVRAEIAAERAGVAAAAWTAASTGRKTVTFKAVEKLTGTRAHLA